MNRKTPEELAANRAKWDAEVADQEKEAEAAMELAVTAVQTAFHEAVAIGRVREWWSHFLLNLDDHAPPESYVLSAQQALREVRRS